MASSPVNLWEKIAKPQNNCKKNKLWIFLCQNVFSLTYQIKVITKLPNSEQSYKGKVKNHKYINRTTVLPVLFKYCYKYCYSDSQRILAEMKGGGLAL
jgi:hypothetical protein